jgi:SAM-dependent MidA family methyltransferase
MSVSVQTLPSPSAEERAHSEALIGHIRDEIDKAGGWISFERYMELALYAPGLGYYSAGTRKLGPAGDFVTAPESSSLFSRCIANQCAEINEVLGAVDVLELGAGSGVMAKDLLLELQAQGRLPEHYFILEVSADLRDRQRATFQEHAPHLLDRVQWLDALPTEFTGVILANEVLDALPVQRFRIRGEQVHALGVAWELGQFESSEIQAPADLERAVREVESSIGEPFPNGYVSEINLRLTPFVAGVAAALTAGVILFIDYGLPRAQYYRPERNQGTLLCHYRHRFHDDPFMNVGLQDIGAWVDFTHVAEAAVAAGLAVAGFTTQAHFLIGNGIERFLAPREGESLVPQVQLARQAMLLTLPGEMGERFKVIGLTRNYDRPLAGFAVRDMAASL